MPIYSNNEFCSTELFEALNDTDGFSHVSTNAKKYFLVFGVRKSVSILEFKASCIDINLKWLSLCSSAIEGNHIRIKLTKTACQIFDKITVKVLSNICIIPSIGVVFWIVCQVIQTGHIVYLPRYPCITDLMHCLVWIMMRVAVMLSRKL